MNHLDQYIKHADGMKIIPGFKAIIQDAKDALAALPRWERGFHIFWLLGPFILLIERTPADIWLTILALTFAVRSVIKRDGGWLRLFWVKAAFMFWFWCLISGAVSYDPAYSIGEAFIWVRFPLFAMATAFWLAQDKRFLYAMLLSVALGTLVMCCILSAEILIIGQEDGRLLWPYGDKTPGNYMAKVGLPAFTVMVALAVSVKGRIASISGLFALFSIMISVMTGERINFLIRACGGMLAGLVWKPMWHRYLVLIMIEVLAVVMIFILYPGTAGDFTDRFIKGATDFKTSGWLHTINSGIVIAKDNLIFGIGPGNFRFLSYEMLEGIPFTRPDNHPHNYYSQMLCETGIIGLILGVVFLWSMIWACFRESFKNRDNVFIATAWVMPFGLFWPLATSADFFGQWNNIFMWSAVAIAMTSVGRDNKKDT
jgi:O-antigen ligase